MSQKQSTHFLTPRAIWLLHWFDRVDTRLKAEEAAAKAQQDQKPKASTSPL